MSILLGVLLSLVSFQALALPYDLDQLDQLDQYPEDRIYGSRDRGFMQYGAPSMYKTDTYALTFDDGPNPTLTPKLLDVLKAYDVKVTFFIITENVTNATLPILKRMLDEGHIIASHGVQHLNSNDLTEAKYKKNLKDSFLKLKEIYAFAGKDIGAVYYRYPYAAYGNRNDYHHMNVLQQVSNELFGDNCIQFAFWDIDSADWVQDMTSEDVFTNLKVNHTGGRYYDFKAVRVNGRTVYQKVPLNMTNPTHGGVILQHDIQARTIEGTRLFLEYAKNNGIKLTTLPEVQEFAVQRECRFL